MGTGANISPHLKLRNYLNLWTYRVQIIREKKQLKIIILKD